VNIPLGSLKLGWEDGIKMRFKETGYEVRIADFINVGEDMDQLWALVNTAMNIRYY
jgi:hypothetical protein